jgi:hypothetical protein
MGALVGRGSWKPLPWHPRLLALIDRTVAHDFMTGFDGLTNFDDERAHNLGKLFRSLYP